MDPQEQFKKRYEAYVSQRNLQVGRVQNEPPRLTKSPFNKFYFLGIIAGIILVLPVAYLYFNKQVTHQSSQVASTPSNQITNAQIDLELQKIWGPYYNKAKNDPKLRTAAKQNIQLRLAATKAGISSSSVASSGTTNYQSQQSALSQALQNKVVTLRKINALTGFVGLNPLNPTLYNMTLANAKTSMEAVRNLMVTKNESMPQAFSDIKASGNYYTHFTLRENLTVTADSKWDKPFLKSIMNSKQGDISPVVVDYGSLLLFQVIEAQDTPYSSVQNYIETSK